MFTWGSINVGIWDTNWYHVPSFSCEDAFPISITVWYFPLFFLLLNWWWKQQIYYFVENSKLPVGLRQNLFVRERYSLSSVSIPVGLLRSYNTSCQWKTSSLTETMEFSLNGTELSLNSENLRNHWGMNWVQYKDLLCCLWLCGWVVASLSLTQEILGSNPPIQ